MSAPAGKQPMGQRSRRSLIRLAARSGGVTLADLMRARVVTMREAWRHLAEVQATGRLVRSGGREGKPFRWSVAEMVR